MLNRRRIVRILDKYLFSEAVSLYLIGFFGFLAFLIINQLFLEGDRLLNPNFPTKEILKLILLNVPYFITLTIPVSVLFATLMSMGRLAKDNEIDAFFTNGIHLSRLFIPFLVLALLNVVLNFYVHENLVPKANAMSEKIYQKFPYLREQEGIEVDPVIVKLPEGAFFAASYVDKKNGSVFYGVYDTLESDLGVEKPRGERKAIIKQKAKDTLGQKPPEDNRAPQKSTALAMASSVSGKLAGKSEKTSTQPKIHLRNKKTNKPEVKPGKDGAENKSANSKSSLPSALAPAPEGAPQDGKGSLTEAQPSFSRSIRFATNGNIVEDKLQLMRHYLYIVDQDGMVGGRREENYSELDLGIPLKDIFTTIRTPEQLSREELQRQTQAKREIGLNPAKDATDLYLKYSMPFSSLFLALVAVPLSLRAPRDERLLGLIFVYLLGTGYYLVHFVCKLMGYNEILPPFLAAWMQNIVFFGIGLVIFAFSRK